MMQAEEHCIWRADAVACVVTWNVIHKSKWNGGVGPHAIPFTFAQVTVAH